MAYDDDECENIPVSISPEQWAHFVDQRRVPGGPDNQSVYSACVDIKVYIYGQTSQCGPTTSTVQLPLPAGASIITGRSTPLRRIGTAWTGTSVCHATGLLQNLELMYCFVMNVGSDDLTTINWPDVFESICKSTSRIQGMVQSVVDGKTEQRFWVDTWPDPKAVVITPVKEVAFLSNEYWVFTMDQSALKYLLDTEGVVDWETSVIFAGLTRDDIQTLEEVANKHGCRVDLVYPEGFDVYYADKDRLQLVDTPMGLKLRQLSCEHAQVVNDTWMYNCGNVTLAYFEFLIKNYPSLGLFDDKGNLLAFELTTHYGSMGSLYVLPEHRRKGYASCLISALTQRTLAAGRAPFVFMDQHNDISIGLHRKMGFKKANVGLVSWIRTETKERGSSSKPTKCCL